jgi:hypothetical protein
MFNKLFRSAVKSSSVGLPQEVLEARLEIEALKEARLREEAVERAEQEAAQQAALVEKGIEEAAQDLLSAREALKLAEAKTSRAIREHSKADDRALAARNRLRDLLEGKESVAPKPFESPEEHAERVLWADPDKLV